jgi:probable HAF family extracellular repeat protein
MQDLGTLGGPYSDALGINVLGQVTGYASTPDNTARAFRWTTSRGMRDLGTLGGPSSHGLKINALGQVTGYADTTDGASHAFRWTP